MLKKVHSTKAGIRFVHAIKTKTVNLENFIALDLALQWEILRGRGAQVAKRPDKEYSITLYKVGNFFVEVLLHRIQANIAHLRGLHSSQLPREYLNSMAMRFEDVKSGVILYQ